MAPFKQARVASVLLLSLTLAAGVLIGVAWSERSAGALDDPVEIVGQPADVARPDMAEQPAEEDERESRPPTIYELDLNPEQRGHVDELVQHFQQGLEVLDAEMERELWRRRGRLASAVRDSIKSVLRPEQVMVYDSLLAERYGSGRRNRDDDRGDGRDRDRDQRPGNPDRK